MVTLSCAAAPEKPQADKAGHDAERQHCTARRRLRRWLMRARPDPARRRQADQHRYEQRDGDAYPVHEVETKQSTFASGGQ